MVRPKPKRGEWPRPRPKPGERRIDAAIDHFVELGFPKPQIRRVINDLLKLYGREGWVFLEEGQYHVVLEKLLEEQAQPQQDQKLEAAAADKASPENDMQVSQENDMRVSQDSDVQVSPGNHIQISPGNHVQVSGVKNVGPFNKSHSALELQASHNSSPSFEPVLPMLPSGQAAPKRPVRPPCYGWISEESDAESEPEDGEVPFEIPIARESLPFKRRRPSRWDVGPNW